MVGLKNISHRILDGSSDISNIEYIAKSLTVGRKKITVQDSLNFLSDDRDKIIKSDN